VGKKDDDNWAGKGFTKPYTEIPADPQDDEDEDEDDWIYK
jgi:hypothetical protein